MAKLYNIYDMYNVNDDNTDKEKSNVIVDRTNGAILSNKPVKSIKDFVAQTYPRNYIIARHLGLPKELALQRAIDLTMQQGHESGNGTSYAYKTKNNRSGFMRHGKTMYFASPDENDISIVKSFQNNPNWLRAINSNNSYDYFYQLQHPKSGEHPYEHTTTGTDQYYNKIQGAKTLRKTINEYLKSGITNSWTMNSTRPDLEDVTYLA